MQYREVWEALLKFESDRWDLVTEITNVVKHHRGLQLEHTPSGLVLVHAEARLPLIPLLQNFLKQVRVLTLTLTLNPKT